MPVRTGRKGGAQAAASDQELTQRLDQALRDSTPHHDEVIEYFDPEQIAVWDELDIRIHSRTQEAIAELRQSIFEHGVKQPCRAQRRVGKPPRLFMGFTRRLSTIGTGRKLPVILEEISDAEALAVAIIENVGRTDLSPIEEGLAYQRLQVEFGLSTREISRKVGKDQAVIMARLGLLRVRADVQQLVVEQRLTPTHVRDQLLRFTKITVDSAREKFFDGVVAQVRADAPVEQGPIETNLLIKIILHEAISNSFPLSAGERNYRDQDVPLFDAKEHDACGCGGPQFIIRARDTHYHAQEAVRCWRREWYQAAQAAASKRRDEEAERIRVEAQARAEQVKKHGTTSAAAAAGEAPTPAGAPRVSFKDIRTHFRNARPINPHDDFDPAGLKNAEIVVAEEGKTNTLYVVNGGVMNHAVGLFTKRVNARVEELRNARAAADEAWLKKAKLEPWMLIQLMTSPVSRHHFEQIAREMSAVGRAVMIQGQPDQLRLAMLCALRSQRGECVTSFDGFNPDPLYKQARDEIRAEVKPEREALVAAALAGAAVPPPPTGIPAELVVQRQEAFDEMNRLCTELAEVLEFTQLVDGVESKRSLVFDAHEQVISWRMENNFGTMAEGKEGISLDQAEIIAAAEAFLASTPVEAEAAA